LTGHGKEMACLNIAGVDRPRKAMACPTRGVVHIVGVDRPRKAMACLTRGVVLIAGVDRPRKAMACPTRWGTRAGGKLLVDFDIVVGCPRRGHASHDIA